jgi:hypothetical protein
MFLIGFYLFFLGSWGLCGYDMYKTFNENKVYAECQNVTYNYWADNKFIHSTHHFKYKNTSNEIINLKLAYSLCPINSSCVTKKEDIKINPHEYYHSEMWDLYSKFNQKTTGKYYYRVITDLKGNKKYISEHTESKCVIRLVS